ncbi:MAG: dGTP triphosphohydrolase [Pirellulales bacterium]|jgi:dGTPase|uniref:Deoxyguanosinetriphosphate triphosphohydrolase-like protein n=1 Tax=uncultured marine bacterium MedDCM-OCT-S04-C7 TaxID=743059 RepID=D6PD68_9BACT|nr:dGTP triphosphohydrolase [uncultured marine bacterium MedDCM-OCT-S04-C7]|tara:strand:+ start:99 stop:1286 length:1188 start_codon:yes stop_codon:yes gene_type:complete
MGSIESLSMTQTTGDDAEHCHIMQLPCNWQIREAAILAPHAMHATDSAGRVHKESPHPFRSPYQRDRDRIVHSAAFRRLAHKTQVFTDYPGDYHRSRLTHTLEVTSIARTLARSLALNEDLAEALALAHDIGHPPLGHAGEDTLDELLQEAGGFNHNRQALRIMTLLEQRYPGFPGLNLSQEVLDAQSVRAKLPTAPPPLLETQVVDAADSIAYDTHDADDAIELGFVRLEELLELPLVAKAAENVDSQHGKLDQLLLRRAVLHELIELQVAGLVTETSSRLRTMGDASVDRIKEASTGGNRLVIHDPKVQQGKYELEEFLFQRVYRSDQVMKIRQQSQEKMRDLFFWYCETPHALPSGYFQRSQTVGLLRSVADYIAGMTDRFFNRDATHRLKT